MHDARPVAVRLDIRPRLRLAPEPPAATRPRFRLPPLALPAAGYWAAMAALTYLFAHLGPRPLEEAVAAEPAPPLVEAPRLTPSPAAEPPPGPPAASAEPAPVVVADATDSAPLPPASLPGVRREPPSESDQRQVVADPTVASRRDAEPSRGDFPEFTDSSRPRKPERAADGPRLDSLLEASDAPAATAAAADAPARSDDRPDTHGSVTSCEAAIAHNNEQLTIGGPRGPVDITREAYASILQNGRYLQACRVPDRTVLEICAAVKSGRAVGVTVVSNPPAPALDRCVRSAVSGLSFPNNERLDVTHTRFDAATR